MTSVQLHKRLYLTSVDICARVCHIRVVGGHQAKGGGQGGADPPAKIQIRISRRAAVVIIFPAKENARGLEPDLCHKAGACFIV
jgi:hypothetical protein